MPTNRKVAPESAHPPRSLSGVRRGDRGALV